MLSWTGPSMYQNCIKTPSANSPKLLKTALNPTKSSVYMSRSGGAIQRTVAADVSHRGLISTGKWRDELQKDFSLEFLSRPRPCTHLLVGELPSGGDFRNPRAKPSFSP